MTKKTDITEKIKEDNRFSEKKTLFLDLFKEIPKNKKTLVSGLIESAAFMRVVLECCQDDVNINGYVEEYKNGENQWGRKRSIAADIYATYIKQYQSVMKTLIDIIPGRKTKNGLDKWRFGINESDFEDFDDDGETEFE